MDTKEIEMEMKRYQEMLREMEIRSRILKMKDEIKKRIYILGSLDFTTYEIG